MGWVDKLTDRFIRKGVDRYLLSAFNPWELSRGRLSTTDFDMAVKAFTSWVYRCCTLNANSVARLSLKLYSQKETSSRSTARVNQIPVTSKTYDSYLRNTSLKYYIKKKDVDIEEIESHPFLDLMKQVNDQRNEFDLKNETELFLELTGNSYWYLVPSNMRGADGRYLPASIWVLPANRVKIVPSKKTFIDHFELRQSGFGNPTRYEPEEIVHFRFPNPNDILYGMGPLQGAANAVDVNQYIKDYEIGLFKNQARPDFVFKMEKNVRVSDPDRERFKTMWQDTYGGTKSSGKVGVLPGGMDLEQIGWSPKDLSFLIGRGMTMNEICFKPDTLIITDDGLKPIQDIIEGNKVLTHRGRFRPVTKTYKRSYNGQLIGIEAKGFEEVFVTPNHPFLSIKAKPDRSNNVKFNGQYEWKKADELICRKHKENGSHYSRREFDNLVFPELREGNLYQELDMFTFANKAERVGEDYIRAGNAKGYLVNRWIKVDNKFGKLIGYFLAEGSTGDHQTIFYFHKNEEEYCNEVRNLIKNIFGVDSSIFEKPESNVRVVRNSNRIVRDFFAQFGHKAPSKKLTPWCFEGNKNFWAGIIEGMMNGDGHKPTENIDTLTSTSKDLIWQIRLLLLSFEKYSGIVTMKPREGCIRGKKIKSGISYCLSWREEKEGTSSIIFSNGFLKSFLKEKHYQDYEGQVYNLEVKDDDSYVTVGGTVHNCTIFGVPMTKMTTEKVNRSNMETGEVMYQTDTISPRLRLQEQKITEKVLPIYDSSLFTVFEENIPLDREFRVTERESNLKNGYSSINEERKIDGREPVEWGEQPILPLNLVPFEMAGGEDLRELAESISGKIKERLENE